ncbi:port-related protein [Flammeovirgaceae bacterium 311]|nr:port-related protein [Flammeovirgaceae bacterium 311]
MLLLLALFTHTATAQETVNMNQENLSYGETRFISFGFLLGGHTSSLRPKFSKDFAAPSLNDTLNITTASPFGFSIGFLTNFKVAQYLDVRLMPKVAFYDYKLSFHTTTANDESVRDALADFTTVDVPLSFKYKSMRRGNHRMFITGGVTQIIDVTGKKQKEENQENGLRLNGNNTTADIGFGADFFFPLFKFSPEIRYSYGLVDVLDSRNNQLGRSFDRMGTQMIGIYLVFN